MRDLSRDETGYEGLDHQRNTKQYVLSVVTRHSVAGP